MTTAVDTDTARQPVSPVGDARALVGAAVFSGRPAELAAFYGMLLGLRFEHRMHPDGRDHRICDIAGLHFEIKAARTADGDPTPDAAGHVPAAGTVSTIELSFEVPDVHAAHEYALTLGASRLQAPQEMTWGTWAVVLDPDGNRLGLWARPSSTSTQQQTQGDD